MLKNATAEYYNENPGAYTIIYSTDMINELLDDIKRIIKTNRMKGTLTEQYGLIKNGKGHKDVFLKEAKKKLFPNFIRIRSYI